MVSGLPIAGEDPAEVIMAKEASAEKVYTRYGTHRGSRGVVISAIADPEVKCSTQLLACKFIRKCQKDECPVGVVLAAQRCTQVIQMCWAQYLMNEFIQDCIEAQDLGKEFHYSCWCVKSGEW